MMWVKSCPFGSDTLLQNSDADNDILVALSVAKGLVRSTT
jgi:hypothetical protein